MYHDSLGGRLGSLKASFMSSLQLGILAATSTGIKSTGATDFMGSFPLNIKLKFVMAKHDRLWVYREISVLEVLSFQEDSR